MCDANCLGMEVDTVRHGARDVSGCAERADDVTTQLGRNVERLRAGSAGGPGWSGSDADQFFADFDAFLPSVSRVLNDHVRPAAHRMDHMVRRQIEASGS